MTQWYYTVEGKRQGPVEEDDLIGKIRDGFIKPMDLVWNESLGDKWAVVSTIPALLSPVQKNRPLALKKKDARTPAVDSRPEASERPVVAASFQSFPDSPAPTSKGFPGLSFLVRVVIPVVLVVGGGLAYRRHADAKKTAKEAQERAVADAKRDAYLSTPQGYISEMLTHGLQLRFLTDFGSPDKSGLYIFGWILNNGDKELSSVNVRVSSGGLTQDVSLGPIKANGQTSFDQEMPNPGFGMNALYTAQIVDVNF